MVVGNSGAPCCRLNHCKLIRVFLSVWCRGRENIDFRVHLMKTKLVLPIISSTVEQSNTLVELLDKKKCYFKGYYGSICLFASKTV